MFLQSLKMFLLEKVDCEINFLVMQEIILLPK